MRKVLVSLLVYLLGLGLPLDASGPKLSPKQQIQAIQAGKILEVKFLDKQKVRGRLGAVREEDFVLQVVQNEQVQARVIRFADVKSVKEVAGLKPGHTAAWVAVGAVAAVGVAVLIVVLKYLHNE